MEFFISTHFLVTENCVERIKKISGYSINFNKTTGIMDTYYRAMTKAVFSPNIYVFDYATGPGVGTGVAQA